MQYEALARAGAAAYREKEAPLLLAIESSCDETAAAVLCGARTVCAMTVFTQIPLHQKFGGVVPEIAARSHVEKVGAVTEAALKEAGVSINAIDAVAVTYGPGLVGALLVGLSYAKGLALAAGKPFVGVNHIAGHIAANYLTYPDLKPPFVCLVASGGHSHIVRVDDYCTFMLQAKRSTRWRACWGLAIPAGRHLKRLRAKAIPMRFPSMRALTTSQRSISASPG